MTPCTFEIPELPDECLTEGVYVYLVDLRAERDAAQANYARSIQETAAAQTALALANDEIARLTAARA